MLSSRFSAKIMVRNTAHLGWNLQAVTLSESRSNLLKVDDMHALVKIDHYNTELLGSHWMTNYFVVLVPKRH